MAWFKLDDSWLGHPRMRAAGKDARALWIAGGLHCSQQLTDGRIDKATVPMIAAMAEVRPTMAKRLVEVGAWVDHGDHYEMHDFLDYNPTREKVLAERERWKSNKQRQRERKSTVESPVDIGDVPGGHAGESPVVSPPPRPVPSPTSNGVCNSTSRVPAGVGTDESHDAPAWGPAVNFDAARSQLRKKPA